MGNQEVDWDRLDKKKMFVYGAGMFSGVTVALYPLTVIKTKQMTLPGISGGFKGFKQTVSTIMRSEGVPGFYRGFNTVIFGMLPARAVYLTALEWTKAEAAKGAAELGFTGPAAAGVANFMGGAAASLATQAVNVPIDVISQKQMVHGDETVVARHQHGRMPPPTGGSGAASSGAAAGGSGPAEASAAGRPAGVAGAGTSSGHAAPSTTASASHAAAAEGTAARSAGGASTSGRPAAAPAAGTQVIRRVGSLQMIRLIIKEEGIGGLYRGFGASVATFVPSSAVWWGAYGAYQKLLWSLQQSGGGSAGQAYSSGEVMKVQTTSSVLAGCTSSLVTTPLDLVKTRIQVSYKHDGATPTFGEVARQILREEGPAGFLRGALPRMINASLWGTCMVTVYEYLKRVCAKDEEAVLGA